MDPVTGIFTTPDPILNTEDQRGFTPYTYAFGNVINTSDPSGLRPTCDCNEDNGGIHPGAIEGSAAQLQAEYMLQRPAPPLLPVFSAAPVLNWWDEWIQTRFAPPKPISGGGWVWKDLGFTYVPSAKNDFAGQQIEAERKANGWKNFDDLLSSMPYTAAAGGLSRPIAKQAAKEAAEAAAAAAAKKSLSVLNSRAPAIRANVDDAISRAAAGKVRFPNHDGKPYKNRDGLLPHGDYKEWTAAPAGGKRGPDRIIIEGPDAANPNAIYYWDHVNPPVQIR